MQQRKKQAFTPGTTKNHLSQIKLYIGFCYHFGLQDINPSTETICLYVEFLAQNVSSPKTVANYLSSVRFLHKWIGAEHAALDSFEVTLMVRSCFMTMKHVPNQRRPLTPDLIRQLLSVAQSVVPHFPLFKCAVVFSFFGFFRISNITPRVQYQFDPAKHTCRGDIIHADPGLLVLLKWTKTNQYGQNTQLVPLPATGDELLCPVIAFDQLCAYVPTSYCNQPLLSLPSPPGDPILPVRQEWLSKNLSLTLSCMGHDPQFYSFHSFRRSGATTAWKAGVEFSHIKSHGGWKSEAFWTYITNITTGHSQVSAALALV